MMWTQVVVKGQGLPPATLFVNRVGENNVKRELSAICVVMGRYTELMDLGLRPRQERELN